MISPIIIQIDTRSISESYFMDQDDINNLMDNTVKDLTKAFATEWQNEANRTLKSSRQEYVANINVVDEGFAKGAVVLTGWLPNAVENGVDGYDMKTYFLEGPNAKLGKNGNRYNTIPFSAGTPGALEENFNGGIMPTEVYDIVKNRPTREPLEKYDLKDLPYELKEPKRKQVISPRTKSIVEYQHKSSLYEGISKRTDLKTGQNTYGSFRRVSDNSADNSWIHPGIDAQHISEKVLAEFDVPREMGRILDKYLK